MAVRGRGPADDRHAARLPRAPAGVRATPRRPAACRARLRDRLRARARARSVLQVAATHDFPVFEVPYETPFIAITEAAFSQLLNEQYAVLRRALAAQERLERIVLSERGLDALAAALATLVGASVLVFDAPRGAAGPSPVQATARARHAGRPSRPTSASDHGEGRRGRSCPRSRTRAARSRCRSPRTALRAASRPAPARGAGSPRSEAWLVAVKDGEPLSDFDRLTLRQAVTIVALELLRARVAGRHRAAPRRRCPGGARQRRADRHRARPPARAVRAL